MIIKGIVLTIKIMKSVVLFLLATLCSIGVFAAGNAGISFSVNDIYYRQPYKTSEMVLVSYHTDTCNYSDSIVIPETVIYKGTTYTIHGIDDITFSRCTNLSVTFYGKIDTIRPSAFEYCRGVTLYVSDSATVKKYDGKLGDNVTVKLIPTDSTEQTGIETIESPVKLEAYASYNTIYCNVENFKIYNLQGQNVTNKNGNLTTGVYVVVTETGSEKVFVK